MYKSIDDIKQISQLVIENIQTIKQGQSQMEDIHSLISKLDDLQQKKDNLESIIYYNDDICETDQKDILQMIGYLNEQIVNIKV